MKVISSGFEEESIRIKSSKSKTLITCHQYPVCLREIATCGRHKPNCPRINMHFCFFIRYFLWTIWKFLIYIYFKETWLPPTEIYLFKQFWTGIFKRTFKVKLMVSPLIFVYLNGRQIAKLTLSIFWQ